MVVPFKRKAYRKGFAHAWCFVIEDIAAKKADSEISP
ncbi:MAG: hypothetical protein CM1200mP30_22860 [Pseudomonadota bacterium]|nr:MAG: hypothetical protein CM1200mP30_22860 [Pseudomonadota bacterium]